MAQNSYKTDRQIDDLVSDVQRHHQPKNVVPQPPNRSRVPIGRRPYGEDFGDGGQFDRRDPPPWFEPAEPHGDEDFDPDDVPIVSEPIDLPEPSVGEDREVGRTGIEALAYYAPFHFYGQQHWGIYIRDKGLAQLAYKFKAFQSATTTGHIHLTPSDSWIFRCAYYFLLEHEYFHFQTELAASRFEYMTSVHSSYSDFFHDGYAAWLEEGMANANAYVNLPKHEDYQLSATRLDDFKQFSFWWMQNCQPSGYRDFWLWARSKHYFGKGMRAVTSRLIDLASVHSPSIFNVDPYCLELCKRSKYSRVPIRRVHDSTIPWLRTAKMFPKANGMRVFVYTKDHKPVHIHVEFPGNGKSTKLNWPNLDPIRGEPKLSGKEKTDLIEYMKKYQDEIHAKLRLAYSDAEIPRAELISS